MILLSEVKCYEFAIKPKEWENQDNKAVGNSLGMLRHDSYVMLSIICTSSENVIIVRFMSHKISWLKSHLTQGREKFVNYW